MLLPTPSLSPFLLCIRAQILEEGEEEDEDGRVFWGEKETMHKTERHGAARILEGVDDDLSRNSKKRERERERRTKGVVGIKHRQRVGCS